MGKRRKRRGGGDQGGRCRSGAATEESSGSKRARLPDPSHDHAAAATTTNRSGRAHHPDQQRVRAAVRDIELHCRRGGDGFDSALAAFWELRSTITTGGVDTPPSAGRAEEEKRQGEQGEDPDPHDAGSMSARAVSSPLLRIPATAFNSLLYAAMSQQPPRAEEALQLFSTMQKDGFSPTEASYTNYIRAKVALGLLDEALHTAAKAAKVLGAGVKLRMFSPVMAAFARAGHLDKAYDVEREMVSANLRPLEPECREMLACAIQTKSQPQVWKLIHRIVDEFRVIEPQTMQVLQDYFNAESPGAATVVDSVPKTGVCPNCSTQLGPIYLSSKELEVFQTKVQELAIKRESVEGFSSFQEWAAKNGPFGAVIDGANVGLYHTNYEGGKFSFAQVEMVMEAVKQKLGLDKPPLLVLHKRRCEKGPARDEAAQAYLNELRKQRRLYASPPGSNDDWYWLWAAVSEGKHGYLITNDEMRDHIFEQLGPCYFHRWKERHMVRFHFKQQEIQLTLPDVYSKYCQKGEAKRASRPPPPPPPAEKVEQGQVQQDAGGCDDNDAVWHFASQDGRWLCVS